MEDRDILYYHFSNLILVLIGLFSIQSILPLFSFFGIFGGTMVGFFISWQLRGTKIHHMETFIGMLSLASVVIILGRLYDTAITFENLLKIFSIALAWLTLFQSFGLKTGKSYAILQFIAVSLLISSVGMALEEENLYIILLAIFLFTFIFAMRLNLVCEKKRKGSVIIGEQEEIMGLWQQIKVGALMFIFVFIVAALVYPFVPRFENLSLRWIPSTLMGIPEQVPLLKLLKQAPLSVKDEERSRRAQFVKDRTKKRETAGMGNIEQKLRGREEKKEKKREKISQRFAAKEFNKNIDIFHIDSLTIKSDKSELPQDSQCQLRAELKMNDGSVIPATKLVDWKVTGSTEVTIEPDGTLVPKGKGLVEVSASYLGTFSNDIRIKITSPLEPIRKKSWLFYLLMFLLWLLILALLALIIWLLRKQRRLVRLAIDNPREFIKEIYLALCRGFKIYGVPRFNYVAHREFLNSLRNLLRSPDSMCLMTEQVLEARFSTHDVSLENSKKILQLFHEVKDTMLQRQGRREFWRSVLFRLLLLDVLLVPRKIQS